MKLARVWAPLLIAALVIPGALGAQRGRGGDRPGGWMGIRFEWREDDDRTAWVDEVVRGSPAERAGVRRGDEVLGINGGDASRGAVDALRESLDEGETVRLRLRREGREEAVAVVAAEWPDDQVIVLRDGEVFTLPPGEGIFRRFEGFDSVEVRLDSLFFNMDSLRTRLRMLRPDSTFRWQFDTLDADGNRRVFRYHLEPRVFREQMEGAATAFEQLLGRPFLMELGRRALAGAELAEMNEGLGKYFHTSEGVLVLRVSPETPAARAGLEAGDVIVQVGGRDVDTVEEFREAILRSDDGRLSLEVMREGRRRTLQLQWDRPDTFFYRPELPGRPRSK